MDYKNKYLKYKKKYFELKNNLFKNGENILYLDKKINKYTYGKIININNEIPTELFYEIKLNDGTIRNTIIDRLKKLK